MQAFSVKNLTWLLLEVPVCPDFQFKETESVTEPSGACRMLSLMMSVNVLPEVGSIAWAGQD